MTILDIRTAQEYAQGHVAGAVLVPTPLPPLDRGHMAALRRHLQRATAHLPEGAPIGVYCKKGKRASIAAHMLRQMGFATKNLGGVHEEPLPSLVRSGELRFTS